MKPDPHNDGYYIEDDDAARRAEQICSQDCVRLDFYDIQSREHPGWLQNNPGFTVLKKDTRLADSERAYRFCYI